MSPDQMKGLDGQCATVTVKGADGSPVNINEVDFDPAKHEKFEAAKPVEAKKEAKK